MSLKNVFAACLLASSVALFPSVSYGFNILKTATVTKSSGEIVNIIAVDGQITPGDATKFIALFKKTGYKNLWISSPGGAVDDSLKIANFVRENNIRVVVPPKEKCGSGCSFIFLAAKEKALHFTSKLGVHRSATYLMKEGVTIETAEKREDETSKIVDKVILNKLVEWQVPLSIIIETLKTSQLADPSISVLSSVDLYEAELNGYKVEDDKEFFSSKISFSEENYK